LFTFDIISHNVANSILAHS